MSFRAFIAVDVRCGEELRKAIEALRGYGRPLKPVSSDIVHITLKFLGDTPAGRREALAGVAREVAGRCAPVEIRVQGLGSFPPGRPPQVIWAGCAAGEEAFAALGQDLDAALAVVGLAEAQRRPFTPHLTLGRVRGGRNLRELTEAIARSAGRELGAMRLERFLLVRSELRPEGPVYTALHEFGLHGEHLG